VLGAAADWITLGYGLYAAAVQPVLDHDDVQIAVGGEIVVLALAGFVFSGHRPSLGWALIVTGLAVPATLYSTASLYWDDTTPFASEAFWTAAGLGAVAGLPLVLLGVRVLRRPDHPRGRDPWWLLAVRWLIFGGLWVVVLAFRGGDWDAGVALVWLGGAVALLGLALLLPRRLGLDRRGVGRFLLFLGLAGVLVVAVAAGAAGSHMSAAEATAGLIPAAVVAVLGGLLAALPARTPATGGAPGTGGAHETDERIEEIAADV
jgi:hypothetical protein